MAPTLRNWWARNVSARAADRALPGKRFSQGASSYEDRLFDPSGQSVGLLLYGGCLAENLANAGRQMGWQVDHLLYQSGMHERPQIPARSSHDAALAVFSFRTVLGQVAERLLGFHDADLLYQKGLATETLLDTARTVLDELVGNFCPAICGTLPVLVLAIIEPPPTSSGLLGARRLGGIYRLARDLNDYLAESLENRDNIHFLEINDLLRAHGDGDGYDGYDFCYAHSGIRSGGGDAFSSSVLRRAGKILQALRQEQPVKLIVTDLDNTLWKGVLAEEDEIMPGEHTEGWPVGYAEALMECRRRGILLAICSKNEEATTRANFDRVWYGRIRLEDFCSVKISWRPKPENLAEILQEVNILPEHVLFVDDSPLEIAEVARAFPEMRTLTGDPHRWRMELLYGVPFQVAHISEEASRKTALLQAKIRRDREMAQVDRQDYLRDLQLRAELFSLTEAGHARFLRVQELLNRTNQFNTTGERRDTGELSRFLAQGGRLVGLRASDRLADHGIVAVGLVQENRLVQMVLSCRVFGLGLEEALLHHLAAEHARDGAFLAGWRDTGRNATARQFLERHFREENGGDWHLQGMPEWPGHLRRMP